MPGSFCAEVLQGLLRGVVFVVGAVFGYLYAVLFASYPAGGPRFVAYAAILAPLALALAAPVCWFFAETRAAARWTLRYVGAWGLWFAVNSLAVWMF